MSEGVVGVRPIRAGWTAPLAAAGFVVAGAGWWIAHQVAAQHSACQLMGILSSLPGVHNAPSACGGVNAKYYASLGLRALGLLCLLVAAVAASRRGRAASKSGHPWPVQRALESAAGWIDRRLPGRSAVAEPRLSPSALGTLAVVLLGVGAYFLHGAWSAHQRGVEHHRHLVAQRQLAALALPAGLQLADPGSGGCSPSPNTVCATSAMVPQDVRPVVERLVGGSATNALCEMLPAPSGMDCPVTVYGKIAGYPAVVNVFRHLMIVRDGKPPAGAVPVKPGSKHAFYLGSDITIGLITRDS